MFQMFQEKGKPLFIDCPLEEVKELAQSLDYRGLAIRTSGLASPDDADALIEWRDTEFG
jgi:pimeloyl-CoA synthetase